MFIICSILAANLDSIFFEMTAKVLANELTIRKSGELAIHERQYRTD
jgi:hypothetical protein